MDVVERYFAALAANDWEALAGCLAASVDRTGPYLDRVCGRDAYVAFLAEVIPTLPNYALRVRKVHRLSDASAVVELSEILDVDGVSTEFPEAIFFDLDADGSIARVDVYIKQPGGPPKA